MSFQSIYLISKEKEYFKVNKDVAKISKLLYTILKNQETEIPLEIISSKYLEKIIQFMNYYSNNPFEEIEKPIKSNNLKDFLSEWYINFIDLDIDEIFELIYLSNYLHIQPLLDLTSLKIAIMIKEKNMFNINLKPEEEIILSNKIVFSNLNEKFYYD